MLLLLLLLRVLPLLLQLLLRVLPLLLQLLLLLMEERQAELGQAEQEQAEHLVLGILFYASGAKWRLVAFTKNTAPTSLL